MIKYRYKKVNAKGVEYILVEIIDYDLEDDKDFFDTISHNNNWGKLLVLMQDRKITPGADASYGIASVIHAKFLASGGDIQKFKWVGPFEL